MLEKEQTEIYIYIYNIGPMRRIRAAIREKFVACLQSRDFNIAMKSRSRAGVITYAVFKNYRVFFRIYQIILKPLPIPQFIIS